MCLWCWTSRLSVAYSSDLCICSPTAITLSNYIHPSLQSGPPMPKLQSVDKPRQSKKIKGLERNLTYQMLWPAKLGQELKTTLWKLRSLVYYVFI